MPAKTPTVSILEMAPVLALVLLLLSVCFAGCSPQTRTRINIKTQRARIERDFDKGGFRMKFEKGLSEEQRDQILDMMLGLPTGSVTARSRADCPDLCDARRACLATKCWRYTVGYECLTCAYVDCCPQS